MAGLGRSGMFLAAREIIERSWLVDLHKWETGQLTLDAIAQLRQCRSGEAVQALKQANDLLNLERAMYRERKQIEQSLQKTPAPPLPRHKRSHSM